MATTVASAQTNYLLSSGAPVAGGNSSNSATYQSVGAVPLTAGGVSSSANFTVSGGVVPMTFGTPAFTAAYSGSAEDTITKVDKPLKVWYLSGPDATTGSIYYRYGGATSYQAANMTAGTGDTLIYNLPASLLGVRGLEYYFVVTQGTSVVNIGSGADPYVFIVQLTDDQAQRPTALTATKYRIVGVPISISGGNSVTTVFDELGGKDITKWRLFSYNTAADTIWEFPDASGVSPGRGYWLIMRSPVSYGASGLSVRPNRDEAAMDYYQVVLESGWNLVSNPLPFNVVWSEVRFDTGGLVIGHSAAAIEDSAYWFNGSAYVTVQTIPAWDGFFIYAVRSGVKILFPYHENTAPAAKPVVELAGQDNWKMLFRLESNGFIDDGNFIGVRSDAAVGEDQYDYSEPPPAPGAPYVAFRLPEGNTRLRRMDIRPPFDDGSQWTMVMSPGTNRTLAVTGIGGIPDNMKAVLAVDDGTIVQVTDGSRIKLSDQTRSATLLIGTKAFLEQESGAPIPIDYALDQNHPNPFNPFTNISFSIRESQHVHLAVYNILGQLVRTLVDEEMVAGRYERTWNGDDNFGRAVASGIYFYRLNTGKFTQCRKMALLK